MREYAGKRGCHLAFSWYVPLDVQEGGELKGLRLHPTENYNFWRKRKTLARTIPGASIRGKVGVVGWKKTSGT